MKQTILILSIAVLITAGFALHASNASYAQAQAKVLATESANDTTTAQLNALKRYVTSHSGATVTVVLTTAYNSAVQQVQAEVAAGPPINASLYAAAQAACAGKTISTVQAACNAQYLQAHTPSGTTPVAIAQPKLSDYTYHFVAPFLTIDLATAMWALAFVLILILCLPVLRPKPYL